MDLLDSRVGSLETMVHGGQEHIVGGLDIKTQIARLIEDTSSLDQKVPQLKACRELLSNMHVDITKRKTTLGNIQERVNELVESKASIEQSITDLRTLKELSKPSILNFDELHDIPVLEQRLNKIEGIVKPLIQQAMQQSEQIDAYLDTYEQLMSLCLEAERGLLS